MEEAISQFWTALKKGGVGLFFFAGHGLQVGGDNYLVPTDARLEVEKDVKYECVDAGRILARMEDAGNDLNLVILDACRNNPFARRFRGVERGLARMDAPAGSLLAFATAPGSVAADGEGRNGLYTGQLLKVIQTPGLTVEQVFKRVRDAVMRTTQNKQVPWESTSLRGEFYFAGGPQAVPVQAVPPAAKQQLSMAKAPKDEPRPEQTWQDPVTGMEFVWVPKGCFQMGSTQYDNEKPVHEACLSGFWLGRYEVTQGQWLKVMGHNPSYFKKGDTFPVEEVSWDDAKAFIAKLNPMGSAKFRLPTEAEWEYACRSGGKAEKYAGGDELDRVAWWSGNSGVSTHAVGTKVPNGLGLFDMSGNVWEWVEDVYSPSAYSSHPRENPMNTGRGSHRVLRGGSWHYEADGARCSRRGDGPPDFGGSYRGFRLVREP